MLSCGIAFVYLVGLMTNWRALALLGSLPCLVQLLGLFVVPESSRWLVKVGDAKDYEATLRTLRGENMDISHEAADIKVSLGLMGLAGFGWANGIVFYATAIFESAGFSGAIGTIAMAITQLPPTMLGVFLMDNYGRRPLLLYSAIGMCTTCFSVALSFLMKDYIEDLSSCPL